METSGNEIKQFLSNKYSCEFCDYSTSRLSNYNNHLKSNKHIFNVSGNKIKQLLSNKYRCEKCDYSTNRLSNYNNHLKSKRHIFNVSGNELKQKLSNEYNCDFCDKSFSDRSGLWKHNKKCEKQQIVNEEKSLVETIVIQDEKNDKMINLVLELVKQNTEFKDLLAEQHKYIIEQNKQNQNLQNHFIEISKEKSINNSINNSHNTTNNNNFNLNLFLNETCKNAMNINEFVEQIPVSIDDLENTARLGYVEGISRIFINGLKQLEVNERPIHCSDGKRDTLYIKEGDIWEKDDSDKTRLTNAIRKVGHKNIRMIPEWKKKYPDCEDYYSKKNDLYLKIVNQSMCGGSVEETETNYYKIRKNIIKQVVIDK
jgi:mRNA-degrading endonuclease HigB of HigAB toxin-antitoxin module